MKAGNQKTPGKSAGLKYLVIIPLFMAFLCVSSHSFAQSQPTPPPGGPPAPPPPPDELFKKINPFKKHKKDTAANQKSDSKSSTKSTTTAPPSGPAVAPAGPPPPPNPLNLFKKKKKDTTKSGKN